jgi:hypothetical protein
MVKKFAGLLVLLACMTFAACGNDDAAVTTTMGEITTFTNELVAKASGGADASAAVGEAQKHLDAKKADISAKCKALGNMRATETVTKNVVDTMEKNATAMAGIRQKYAEQSASDPELAGKIDKLLNDYVATLKF